MLQKNKQKSPRSRAYYVFEVKCMHRILRNGVFEKYFIIQTGIIMNCK